MQLITSTLSAILALACTLVAPAVASAHTLLDDESLKLDVYGWARGGYTAADPLDGGFEHGPYINMARLAGSAQHKPWGRLVVQFEGADGVVELLDLIAELRPSEVIAIRIGRLKLPTSADRLMSSSKMPFATRSLLAGYAPGRHVGAELVSTLETDAFVATAQAGWYEASASQRDLLPDGEGNFASIRALVTFPVGFQLHLAYSSLVLADNAPVTDPDAPEGELVRPVELPEVADLALSYAADGLTVTAEGLVAPNTGEELPWGAFLYVLHRWDVGTDFELEPGLRYGVISRDDILTHRATAGLKFYLVGDLLNTLANYELSAREDDLGHAGYLQIQAGF